MRTLTAAQEYLYESVRHRRVHMRVRVEDGDATFQDLTSFKGHDWVISADWGDDIDAQVTDASIELQREFYDDSAAVTMEETRVNRNGGGAYEPLLYLRRRIIIETQVTPIDGAADGGAWDEMFRGRIDRIDYGPQTITINARDLGGNLQDTWIETVSEYGSTIGVAVQTVIQDILDDWVTLPPTLYTPGAPGWNVNSFASQQQSVFDQIQMLADMIAWKLKYRFDSGTSTFRLTLYDPDRGNVAADWTFTPDDYEELSQVEIDLAGIRNAIAVTIQTGNEYESGDAILDTYTAEDAPSIAAFGRRWMAIAEDAVSIINNTTEQERMADAILADLKDPYANATAELPYVHFVDTTDLYLFEANGVHFDTAQKLSVVGFRHTIDATSAKTSLTLRNQTPAGSYETWLEMSGTALTGPMHNNGGPEMPSPVVYEVPGGVMVTVPTTRISKPLTWEIHVGETIAFVPDPNIGSTTFLKSGSDRYVSIPNDSDRFAVGEEFFVRVIAIDENGNRSSASAGVSARSARFGPEYQDSDNDTSKLFQGGVFGQQSRGPNKPPDQWRMSVGTWNTDAKLDDGTIFIVPRTGRKVLLLENTAVATAVDTTSVPVAPGRRYLFVTEWAGSSTTGTNTLSVTVRWYNIAGTFVSDSTVVLTAPATASVYNLDRRVLQPPTSARSAVIRVAKGAAAAYRVAIDRVEFNELDESLQATAMTVRSIEDFLRDGILAPWGDLGWSEFSFGGGGTRTFAKVLAVAAARDPWSECGVFDIGVPNSAGRAGGIMLNDPARAPHLGPPHRGGEWRVKARLSVGTTQLDVWLGLWSNITTYPDAALANSIHGIGIVARAVGGAVNWFGICRAGVLETTLDLGIQANPTWREMGWRRSDTGVVFFVGDDDVGVVNTNVPAQTQALVRVLGLRTADAALKNIQVDYDQLLVQMSRYNARG